jgi:hypothetical protein
VSFQSAYQSFQSLRQYNASFGLPGSLTSFSPPKAPTLPLATATMSSGIEHISEHTPIATTALVQDASNERKAPYNEVDEKKIRSSSSINSRNRRPVDPAVNGETNVLAAKEEEEIEEEQASLARLWRKIRPFALSGIALLILGWWISATILAGTRNRW